MATMYSSINDPALPANVKSMPAHFRHQWLTVYTAAVKRGTAEETARNMANGLVKRTMAMTSEALASGSEGLELAEDLFPVEFGEEQWVSGSDVENRQVSQADAQYDPYGASGGQGCASCQWFVSPNACVNVAGDIQPTGKSRLYFPQVQDGGGMGSQFPFNLTDAEGDPVAQGVIDFSSHGVILGEHALWTTAYQNNLPDSSFAYIEPGGKKDAEGKTTPRSLRHFVYKDGSGKLDETHVQDALGRIPQSNVSAAAKASALRIIHAAAARLGIKVAAAAAGGSSAESGVHGAFQSILGFLGLRDLPAAGGVAGGSEGAGDPPNVVFPGRPMLALSEDIAEPGRLRYWAVASNNFMPDNKGLGFPAAAQQEYVDWVWADPERRMAELQLWHTPGTRLGQDDWVDFDGHFLHSTGLIDAGREELAQRYAADPDIAMSHGYVVVWDEHGRAEGFRSYEKSILPRAYAGNSYTGFGLREDTVAFSEPRKSFLREAGLSDSEITAREHRWEQFAQALEGLGVGSHELELYVMSSAAENSPAGSAQPAAPVEVNGAAASTPAASGAMPTETLTLDGIRAMVGSLLEPISGRLGALEQHALSFDAAVANEWAARAQPGGGFRPATDGRTVPGISDNGRTLTQPVAGQQSAETRPLDPRVMRAIAQGAEAGEQAAEASADPLGWIGKKLQVNPILTGGPTETRG